MGKRYEKEFKIEAVRLALEPGNTQARVERDLGIGQGVISRWKRELKLDGEHAFPGKGRLKPEDAEIRRLKRPELRICHIDYLLEFSGFPWSYGDGKFGNCCGDSTLLRMPCIEIDNHLPFEGPSASVDISRKRPPAVVPDANTSRHGRRIRDAFGIHQHVIDGRFRGQVE